MRIRNITPWDTKTLRRLARGAGRATSFSDVDVLFALEGAHTTKYKKGVRKIAIVRLPQLKGDEWIGLVRQQYGTPHNRSDGLTCGAVAGAARVALDALRNDRQTVGYEIAADNIYLAKWLSWEDARALVPLEPPKPLPQPRDHARERYRRAVELQRTWQRKAKLAATKLKKLRVRIRYYEKILGGAR